MKTVTFVCVTFLSSFVAFGQGTTKLNNVGLTAVTNLLTGQRVPVGTAFMVALYYAPDGTTDESAFVQVGDSVGFGPVAGLFSGGTIYVPTSTPGGWAMVQYRAWETAYGANYEAAVAAPARNGRRALIGKSRIVRTDTGDPTVLPPESPVVPWRYGDMSFHMFPLECGSGLDCDSDISVNDVILAEGSNGVVHASFQVTLGTFNPDTVTVDFTTGDGAARAGQDYVATNGTLHFQAGETQKVVTVTVTPDAAPEPDEHFYLYLSNPVNGYLADDLGVCLITEVRLEGISVDVTVRFNTVAGHRYGVEKSDDIVTWTPVRGAENIVGSGGLMIATDWGAGCRPGRMYRARLIE